MFGYVFVFILTSMVHRNLGYPVNDTDVPLAKSLQSLANHCENKFLATQINNKVEACNFSITPKQLIEVTEIKCFIFYDINRQLCSALRGSKFDLSQSYATRMNTVQKVKVACNESNNWKFTKLEEHPRYDKISEIFQNSVSCLKVCAVHDLLKDDTNFYCQYYQWGLEMLQASATSVPLAGNFSSGDSAPETVLLETPPKIDGSSSVPTSTSSKNLPKLQTTVEHSEEPLVHPKSPTLGDSKGETNKVDKAPSSTNAQPQRLINESGSTTKTEVQKSSPPVTNANSANKELKPNLPPKKKTDNDPLFDSNDDDLKDSKQLQIAHQDDDNENGFGGYLDSEGDLAPEIQQGNIGNDPGMLPDPKVKDVKANKKDVASIVSSLNVEMSQGEFYSNTIQDSFAEDDDHFFSFFLTAIILVIFLYVLYHNKSKFRKVFLGLLVEGRQSGRRRNSRGHEYRRLDTLEQAMSTNSAAPPSKIIY